jgi:calcineurin-like phosphoesterase family protein
MAKTVWTSDLHFSHSNVCKFTNRKLFTSQEDHDEWLITLLNSQIDKSDTVIHCGDFCFKSNYDYQASLLNRLNGNWTMIWGNHDNEDNLKRLKREGVINHWSHYMEVKISAQKACVMHFPIAAWNKQHYGSLMIHGHSHGNYTGKGRILDVGLDSSYNIFGEHKVFTEEEICDIMASKEIFIAEDHRLDKTKE